MIGERLKSIRKEKGLTQKALADMLSTSSSYVSEIEHNKNAPGNAFLVSLKRNLGVSIDWLLTGDGSPYIKESDLVAAQETPKASNVVELRHMELVKGFKDKPRAYEINRQLKELESLDDETFKRIETYIKATVDQVRYAAERSPQYGDRRQSDRRVDTDSSSLGGQDRRTGQDRRKASDGHH